MEAALQAAPPQSSTATAAPVKWASSGAGGQVAGTPRQNRILELHRMHFVQKKGHHAVTASIEAKCKEGRAADAKSCKEHREKIQQLNDKIADQFKNAMAHGSMSVWAKHERDQIEEARQDPMEAKERMVKHLREHTKTYDAQKLAMTERVRGIPPMNVRPKAELEEIEAARQDPQEAKERIEAIMAHRKTTFMQQRKVMSARVQATRPTSFRSKEERARIEDLRQDPEEASEAMKKKLTHLARSYREEQVVMTERVYSRTDETQWTKEEREAIEEARQDPDEAKEKAKAHMKNLAQAYKEHQSGIVERVKANPPLNIRTKEERARIEEARHDPDEARETAKAHMKGLHRNYQEHKREIHERVHANPLVTFRSPRSQEVVAQKLLRDMPR